MSGPTRAYPKTCSEIYEDVVRTDENLRRPKCDIDLKDPQPLFVKFTPPFIEENEQEEDEKWPWPPGKPRPIERKTEVHLQEVLDFICRPHRFTEKDQNWKQQVSDEPVNRSYVQCLDKELEKTLELIQSKTTLITCTCPYRSKIFLDMFSEIIRISTVMMKERGLLLLQVRDDIQMTVSKYEKLYASSFGYGIRKYIAHFRKRLDLEVELPDLKDETDILERMVEAYVLDSAVVLESIGASFKKHYHESMADLDDFRNLTLHIEGVIFQLIKEKTEEARQKALKTILKLELGDDVEESLEDDFISFFTEVKSNEIPESPGISSKEQSSKVSGSSSSSTSSSEQCYHSCGGTEEGQPT